MRAPTLFAMLLLPAWFFAGGCAQVSPARPAAPAVSPEVVDLGGGASVATLEEGRQIFTSRCATCHAPYPVASHSTIEWHWIADEMAQRTRLTPAEKSALLDYVAAVNAAHSALASR